MKYYNALELVNLCIENDLFNMFEGKIGVYKKGTERSPEGWYLRTKEDLAQELMRDEKGINFLINKLKELNVEFKPTKFDF